MGGRPGRREGGQRHVGRMEGVCMLLLCAAAWRADVGARRVAWSMGSRRGRSGSRMAGLARPVHSGLQADRGLDLHHCHQVARPRRLLHGWPRLVGVDKR